MIGHRLCPDCGQPQEWCDRPLCFFPPGHWSHKSQLSSGQCNNLGDRNTDPAKPPYNAWQYMPETMT
jgi:hypothetical protein